MRQVVRGVLFGLLFSAIIWSSYDVYKLVTGPSPLIAFDVLPQGDTEVTTVQASRMEIIGHCNVFYGADRKPSLWICAPVFVKPHVSGDPH